MGKVWFTADTHLGHGSVIKYCRRDQFLSDQDKKELEKKENKWYDGSREGMNVPRYRISKEAIELMDWTIINNINKLVGKDDTLWFLGDWCFANKKEYYTKAKEYRNQINCNNIHLIWGNHDNDCIWLLFNEAYQLHKICVKNQKIVLCHYAMITYDKSNKGSWQLYGHSHSGLEKWADSIMPGRKSMDIGIDNAFKILGEYRPFSFEEIKTIMNSRSGFFSNSHGKNIITKINKVLIEEKK